MRAPAAVAALTPGTAPAAAQTCRCTVQDFTTFSCDAPKFAERSLQTTSGLTVRDDEAVVDMVSDHFADDSRTVRITARRTSNVTAVDAGRARHGAITLPLAPQRRLDRNGHFNAVISVTGSLYANNWLLTCQ